MVDDCRSTGLSTFAASRNYHAPSDNDLLDISDRLGSHQISLIASHLFYNARSSVWPPGNQFIISFMEGTD